MVLYGYDRKNQNCAHQKGNVGKGSRGQAGMHIPEPQRKIQAGQFQRKRAAGNCKCNGMRISRSLYRQKYRRRNLIFLRLRSKQKEPLERFGWCSLAFQRFFHFEDKLSGAFDQVNAEDFYDKAVKLSNNRQTIY